MGFLHPRMHSSCLSTRNPTRRADQDSMGQCHAFADIRWVRGIPYRLFCYPGVIHPEPFLLHPCIPKLISEFLQTGDDYLNIVTHSSHGLKSHSFGIGIDVSLAHSWTQSV